VFDVETSAFKFLDTEHSRSTGGRDFILIPRAQAENRREKRRRRKAH
jgi:hypothetical protein